MAVLLIGAGAHAGDKPPEGGRDEAVPITVTSDSMEASRAGAGKVVFLGDVVAEEDFLLCSDELTVYYDDSGEISRIVAAGNVRVVREGRRARGDDGVYDRVERKVVLTGNAAARECSDTVRGETITFYLDSENMTVGGEGAGRVRARITPKQEEKECGEDEVGEQFQCRAPR